MWKIKGFKTTFLGLLLWVSAVIIRANVSENIHPWQPQWCMWVLSTSITSGMVGWGLKSIYDRRKIEQHARTK